MMPSQTSKVASRRWLRVVISLFFLLLIGPGIGWFVQQPGIASSVQGVILPAALLVVYLAIWGHHLWLGLLLLSPFVLLAPAEFAFIARYRHPSDYDILATLIESNPREIRDFLGPLLWPMAIAFACALAIAFLTPLLAKRHCIRWIGDSRMYVIVAAVSLPVIIFSFAFIQSNGTLLERAWSGASGLTTYASNIRSGFPFGVPLRASQYYESWHAMRLEEAKLQDFRFGARTISNPGHRQIYVFVIGESSGRDHWGLFGYSKPTNPELDAIANLVPLPNMITTWSESRLAIPVLLTRKPGTDSRPYFHEASILRAFSEAGFRTYWLSNQLAVGRHDSPVSEYAYEASHVHFFNPSSWLDAGSYDEVLLPVLSRTIAESSDNLFVVLHTMGSHKNYLYRYPPSFDRFQPSLNDTDDMPDNERLLNSYDNSIIYTDHILASVIKILQDSNAIGGMFYSSDHGEDIPNSVCNLSGHGNQSRPDFTIPALFWYSDAYAETFPDRIRILRHNSERAVTTENVFESLIDLGNITFPSHDASKSLLSDSLRDQSRVINAFGTVDFDHAVIGKNCPVILH